MQGTCMPKSNERDCVQYVLSTKIQVYLHQNIFFPLQETVLTGGALVNGQKCVLAYVIARKRPKFQT